MTEDRFLFFCQLFGPLLFVPLLRIRNFPLFIYGLLITLLATRTGLHEIRFQYVWYIVPFLFIGLLYFLRDMPTNGPPVNLKNKMHALLIAIFFSSFVYSWQYGAALNREYFTGGFCNINFNFTPEDNDCRHSTP